MFRSVIVFVMLVTVTLGDPAAKLTVDLSGVAKDIKAYQRNVKTIEVTLLNNGSVVNGTNYTPYFYFASSNRASSCTTVSCAWVTQTTGVFNVSFTTNDLATTGVYIYGAGLTATNNTTFGQGRLVIQSEPN